MVPTATIFCLAEKVIIADDGTFSIITLMEGLQIGIVAEAEIPLNMTAPVAWAAFASWTRNDGTRSETFEQKIEAFAERASEPYLSIPASVFFSEGTLIMKVRQPVFGMLVGGGEGPKRFVLSIREPGEEQWHECSSWALTITYQRNSPTP